MNRTRIEMIARQFSENAMKLLLENPGNVREMLGISDFKLLEQIEFDRMALVRTTFVQRDYRHLESDVVLRARLRRPGKKGRWRTITIYILIEHQSEPDAFMVFRVLEYIVQIYKSQIRAWRRRHGSLKGLRLQPVLPVVFYTGQRRWESLGKFADLIDLGDEFDAVIPALEPLFLNLADVPAAKLEAAGGFGWVLRLLQQRHVRADEFRGLLRRTLEQLETMPVSERQRWLELLSYLQALVYHERNRSEHEGLRQEIEASVSTDQLRQEVSAMGKTIADMFIDRGRKEGLKKGKKKGKEEGIKEGETKVRQEVLLSQLRERFGDLPAETVAAVAACKSAEQLDIWLRRVLSAATLEDVGVGT